MMKKSLLALSVAAAAMGAQAADVQVYGLIDTSLSFVSSDADIAGHDRVNSFSMENAKELVSGEGRERHDRSQAQRLRVHDRHRPPLLMRARVPLPGGRGFSQKGSFFAFPLYIQRGSGAGPFFGFTSFVPCRHPPYWACLPDCRPDGRFRWFSLGNLR